MLKIYCKTRKIKPKDIDIWQQTEKKECFAEG